MIDLSESALLLIGHGSTQESDGARAALEAHVVALRERRVFAAVAAAFLKGGTGPADALAKLLPDTVYVVPHFMSAGFFVSKRIPELLDLKGPVTERDGRTLHYCTPPALSPGFTEIAGRRLEEAADAAGISASAPALLVGHGSQNDTRSAEATEAQAGALRSRGFDIAACYVEEEPFFEDRIRVAGPLLVGGFFAADGFHAERDVRAALADRTETAYTGALGNDPGLVDLIIEQVRRFSSG